MSMREAIYVREPTYSMSDTEDQRGDWDDSLMSAAYETAVRKANAEIAKQIAMETNTSSKGNSKTNKKKGKGPMKAAKSTQWKEGMQCRTKYSQDGIEYEAVITSLLEENECVVKFIGYENSEVVPLYSLKASRGEEFRMRQIQQAAADKFDDGFESQSNGEMSAGPSEKSVPVSQLKGKKSKKKFQNYKFPDFSALGMPDLKKMNAPTMPGPNFSAPNMPFLPPPPMPMQFPDSENQALSAMLISWYMSGYHTGFYQGIKKVKENRGNQN